MVTLRNGSIILFRSLEEGQVEKLRGLTLGGILVDQLEELDGGLDGERVYDTLLGRLSDPGGPRRLIAITNPAALTHWVYRRLVNPATRDANVRHVQFRMADNPHLPADYVAEMLATKETQAALVPVVRRGRVGGVRRDGVPGLLRAGARRRSVRDPGCLGAVRVDGSRGSEPDGLARLGG